jgi:hypothetical protein
VEEERDDEPSRLSRPVPRSHLAVSWQALAVCATAVAVASLGALVLVARGKQADVLATTALELALIAFVVQFMVFIAQQFAANQQATRGEEVYRQTTGVLTELRATVLSTQQDVGRIVDNFIAAGDQAVDEVTSRTQAGESESEPTGLEAFQEKLSERLSQAFREEGRRLLGAAGRDGRLSEGERRAAAEAGGVSPVVRERTLTDLSRFPDEKPGTHVFWQVHNLPPTVREQLRDMALEELAQALDGREIVSILPDDTYAALRKKHMVRPGTLLGEGSVATNLNALGRAAASLLLDHALPEPAYLGRLTAEAAQGSPANSTSGD